MISPLPGATAQKPGSATLPLPGVSPVLVNAEGRELEGVAEGNLCIAESWPGQARTLYGDHARFVQTYFSTYPGKYFSGDGARRDADGYWWITGRVRRRDQRVRPPHGHRGGGERPDLAPEGVGGPRSSGFPHEIKGQGIYAYVTLVADEEPTEALRRELVAWVRKEIGPIAAPDAIQWAPGLPKTRSGKIMRRILRKDRRRRDRGPGRHLHPGRPRRGRRAGRHPRRLNRSAHGRQRDGSAPLARRWPFGDVCVRRSTLERPDHPPDGRRGSHRKGARCLHAAQTPAWPAVAGLPARSPAGRESGLP